MVIGNSMIHWYSIWKHMRQVTNREVEKRAVMELADYFEKQIDKVILQSVEELKKLNDLKELQGLYQKSRIDKDCIQNAIKTINSDGYSSLSEKTGGMIQKEENINEKHSQETNVLTEVV